MECAQVTEEQRLWTETQKQKAKHNAWPSCLASVYLTVSARERDLDLSFVLSLPLFQSPPTAPPDLQYCSSAAGTAWARDLGGPFFSIQSILYTRAGQPCGQRVREA